MGEHDTMFVRVKVLSGAIILPDGRRRAKGQTFRCTKDFAHGLMRQFPDRYMITREYNREKDGNDIH